MASKTARFSAPPRDAIAATPGVTDADDATPGDTHATPRRFIGGAADPRCYVSAQLGGRGGFGPSNAGAPEEAKERIERQYDILAKRHQALDEQHVRDDGVEKRKYLDALDKLKESGEEKKREALASRAANLSSVMDKACLLKMRRNTMPFWMPSIVRSRRFEVLRRLHFVDVTRI